MNGLYPNIFNAFGINRTIPHRINPSHSDTIINLLYSCNKFLSSSVKKSIDKQIQIPKMKNQNKSYFALSMKGLIHTCWSHTARNRKIIVVIIKHKMNCIINFDSMFFNNNFRVTLSVFSLFFIALIHHFKFAKIYHSNIITKIKSINSFHIQNNVQNFPSRPSLNVTNV